MSNVPSERGRERRSFQDLAKLASSPSLTPSAPKSIPKVEAAPSSGGMRGSDPGRASDSGIVDLKQLAQSDPHAAERAKTTPLATAELFDEDDVATGRPSAPPSSRPSLPVPSSRASHPQAVEAVAAPVASTRTPMAVPGQATPQKRNLVWAGAGAAAILGIAAAALLMVRSSHSPEPVARMTATTDIPAQPTATAANPAPPPAVSQAVALNDPSKDDVVDPSKLPVAAKGGTKGIAPRGVTSKLSKANGTPAPAAPVDPKLIAKDLPASPAQSGSLSDALRQAAGTTPSSGQSDNSSGPSQQQFEPGSVPQKPSQGAVTGALGAALPLARGCLGPDDPVSRATVVFDSSGAVAGVTVSGWASGKPAEACIKAALGKAKVPPFAQSSYTANVTVRPN